ncbi:MAG: Bax inhibitor-1/YccA family protein [Chlamydiia bacterium]|nr:Bax inhibitor-1/YccA family protein [Chlamydiia bacterium]
MGFYDRDYVRTGTASDAEAASFASQVYGWMTIGLGITAVVTWGLARSGLWMQLMPFWWLCALGTLGIGLAINGMIHRLSFQGVAGLFVAYSAVQGMFFGITLPLYAAAYGGQVIWVAFLSAAGISGAAAAYGMFTGADLTHLGRLLRFGLYALVGMTLLYLVMSFFVQVTWMHMFISWLGLGMFIGLTAYDAQQIRSMSYQVDMRNSMAGKLSLVMALRMYINVIMVFWYLLQIFARGRD